MTFDPTKPCQTLNGLSVEIIKTDHNDPFYPIIGLIKGYLDNAADFLTVFTPDGRYARNPNSTSMFDLVNIPEKIEGWVNIYQKDIEALLDGVAGACGLHATLKSAEEAELYHSGTEKYGVFLTRVYTTILK